MALSSPPKISITPPFLSGLPTVVSSASQAGLTLVKIIKMRYARRHRVFPGILIGLVILLIASQFFFHLFFPFHYGFGGYYPWHPFFFFGGFAIIKVILIVALISFIGRRWFWGRRWAHDGDGYRGEYGGYGHRCDQPRADQFQGNYRPCTEWRGGYDRHLGGGQFQRHSRGKAPFERAGNRTSADFVELVSGFGSVERKMASRTFQGGDVTTIMGQLVLDLREADLNGTVHLRVTQIKGVTTILVPKDWDVRAGVGTVFATYQDGEADKVSVDPNKVLVIDGTCVMGDIEVRTK